MRSFMIFCSVLFASVTLAQVTYLTDNFSNTAGSPLTSNGWYAHSGGGTNPILTTSSGLSWDGYYLSGQGNAAAITNTGEDVNRPFTAVNSGALYASFLVNVSAPIPAAGEGFFFHFGFYGSNLVAAAPNGSFSNVSTAFRGRTFLMQGSNASTFKLGLSFNATSATGTTADLNIGQTYLVVVKYNFVSGADNDQVSMFVFAEGDVATYEPATPTLGPFTPTASAGDAPELRNVCLRQYSADQNVVVDGIAVRNFWSIRNSTLMVENFDYPAGNALTSHGWNAHSAAATSPILVNTTGLVLAEYAANAVGRAAAVVNNGQDINRPLSQYATSGNVYASFLMRVTSPVTAETEGFFFHLGQYANVANPVFTALNTGFRGRTHVLQGSTSDKFKLGLSFNANLTTDVSGDLNVGQTYMVVVKYEIIPGATNDRVSLYAFAQGDNFTTEPVTPTIGPLTATLTDPLNPLSPLAADAAAIQCAVLRQYATNQNVLVDGIIVRNHWDMFVPCVTAQGTDVVSACQPYTWIDGNTYTASNNTATHLLPGAAFNGCDSLVTLNLTYWPCTQLQLGDCGATNVSMDQNLRAVNVNAPAYRFRITGPNNGGAGWISNTFILDRPSRAMKFSLVPGSYWGSSYNIEVAVGDGMGNFGPYGNACTVSLSNSIPTTQLQASDCGAVNVNPGTNLLAINVTGATGYRYRVNGANVNNVVVEKTMGGGAMRKLKMNQVAGILSGETYAVQVAIRDAAGNWGAYGPICEVTLMGAPDMVINNNIEMVNTKTLAETAFAVKASLNPFTTDFGIQVLNANDTETIAVVVYDMSGKMIERYAVNPMDIENARFGKSLSSGMYMVEVREGNRQAVIRQIKQ